MAQDPLNLEIALVRLGTDSGQTSRAPSAGSIGMLISVSQLPV